MMPHESLHEKSLQSNGCGHALRMFGTAIVEYCKKTFMSCLVPCEVRAFRRRQPVSGAVIFLFLLCRPAMLIRLFRAGNNLFIYIWYVSKRVPV